MGSAWRFLRESQASSADCYTVRSGRNGLGFYSGHRSKAHSNVTAAKNGPHFVSLDRKSKLVLAKRAGSVRKPQRARKLPRGRSHRRDADDCDRDGRAPRDFPRPHHRRTHTPNEAATLAEEDKYQFQRWALGLVGARPVEHKKGADHGIDGKILFRDDPKAAKPEQIILQVKGGKTGVKDVRDLRGVLDREKAAIGILISVQPPTREMQAEAASAGFYEHKVNKLKYPRIQLRTVKELMTGKGIERPVNLALDETFKKAPTSRRKSAEDQVLPGM